MEPFTFSCRVTVIFISLPSPPTAGDTSIRTSVTPLVITTVPSLIFPPISVITVPSGALTAVNTTVFSPSIKSISSTFKNPLFADTNTFGMNDGIKLASIFSPF